LYSALFSSICRFTKIKKINLMVVDFINKWEQISFPSYTDGLTRNKIPFQIVYFPFPHHWLMENKFINKHEIDHHQVNFLNFRNSKIYTYNDINYSWVRTLV
jgi:hypothetical protein